MNTSITLGDHFTSFVKTQVVQSRYGSVAEVVRAGLRLLEEQEAHLQVLRAALTKGEQSGPPAPIDVGAFLARKRSDRLPAS